MATTHRFIPDTEFSIADDGDSTKVGAFECSSLDTGGTSTFTLPNISTSDTLAALGITQTFTRAQIIDGSTDEIQLKVEGNATQTANLVELLADGQAGDTTGRLMTLGGTGTLGLGDYSSNSDATVLLDFRARDDKTANVLQMVDENSETLFSVGKRGAFVVGTNNDSGNAGNETYRQLWFQIKQAPGQRDETSGHADLMSVIAANGSDSLVRIAEVGTLVLGHNGGTAEDSDVCLEVRGNTAKTADFMRTRIGAALDVVAGFNQDGWPFWQNDDVTPTRVVHTMPTGGSSHTLTWPNANADGLFKNNGSGTLSWLTSTRGSLIYGDSTPSWSELTIGAANALLTSDGTDVSWSTTPTLGSGSTITVQDTDFKIVDNADNTKAAQFVCDDITASQTRTFYFPDIETCKLLCVGNATSPSPGEVAKVDQTNVSSNVSGNITNAAPTGFYMVTAFMRCTTADSDTDFVLSITYNDGAGSKTTPITQVNTGNTANVGTGFLLLYLGSGDVTWSTAGHPLGTERVTLRIRAAFLG